MNSILSVVSAFLIMKLFWLMVASALRPRRNKERKEEDKPIGKALLPYVKGTTDKISRVLKKYKRETVFNTDRKISNMLPSAKTKISLENQGVYEVPCGDCEKTYIGQTNRTIQTRKEEYRNAVQKNEKTSSLAQHVKDTGHEIDFDNTKVLARMEHKAKRIIREAIEIEKHPQNLNTRDDTQRLPTAWKPVLGIKKINKPVTRNGESRPSRTQEPTAPLNARPVTRSHAKKTTHRNESTVYNSPSGQTSSSKPNVVTRSRSKKT